MTPAAQSAVAAVLLGCLLGPLAQATTSSGQATAAAAPASFTTSMSEAAESREESPASGDSKLMLVMDSSGSMAEPAGGGLSKVEAAKESLNTVIDTLPSDQPAGMRVYGAQVRSPEDPNACTDSQLVVPIGSDNRDQLRDAVAKYRPYGETPIGYALQQAGYDLGKAGRRNIILVSDGESTCAQPDPCLVSRDLRTDGVDLRVDVIGLTVGGSARKQLQCVARSGGGIYYDANNPKELTDSLTKLAERAARPYETIGEAVTGAKRWKQAPPISAGDWQDELPPTQGIYDGQRFYRVERELANSTLFVSAAYQAPDGASNIELSLMAPDGTECSSGFDSQVFTDGMLLAVGARAGQLGDEAQPVDTDDPCLTSDHLVAVVSYGDTEQEVPVELRVSEVPEITNLDDLDGVTETPGWEPPEAGTSEVTGGTSFGDAEDLEPGGYAGTIVPGETLTYSVDVDWGEQLNAAAHIDQLTGALSKAVARDPSIYLQIFGPARLPAGTTEASTDLTSDATLGNGGDDDLGLTTGPVTYPNIGYRTGAAQAGTYTVTLFLEDNNDSASLPVPYQLGIGVSGDAAEPPAYDEQPIGDADDPDNNDPDATDAAAPPPTPGEGDDDSGVSGLDWIIGLALLAGVALLLLRLHQQRVPASTARGASRAGPVRPSTATQTATSAGGSAPVRLATLLARRALVAAQDIVRNNPRHDALPPHEARIPPHGHQGQTSPTAPPQSARARPTPPPAVPDPATVARVLGVADQRHGLGLTGPAARATIRALLVEMLADPSEPVEVLIADDDLTHLLDGRTVADQLPEGLSTAANLDAALNWLETELLIRTRDREAHHQHSDPDVSQTARRPRLVLLTRPVPGLGERLRGVLDNGAALGITGIVLGPWRHDATIHLQPDGTTAPGDRPGARPPLSHIRFDHIDADEALQRLASLPRTEQTRQVPTGHEPDQAPPPGRSVPADVDGRTDGNPALDLYRLETLHPAVIHPDEPPADHADPADTSGVGDHASREHEEAEAKPVGSEPPANAVAVDTTVPLSLTVFGVPRLLWSHDGHHTDITSTVVGRQLELLCHLALHPDGIARDTLIQTLWPDSPVDRPGNSLQQATRRLRRAIAEATDHTILSRLVIQEERYRLDPDAITVDYWDFAEARVDARTAQDDNERRDAYERLLALHTGYLANGYTYDWLGTPRDAAEREAADAASRLARIIVEDNPARTLDLLEIVRAFNPRNEAVYRDIMRLQARLRYYDHIPRTYNLLVTRLAENQREPGEGTVAMFNQLQRGYSTGSGIPPK